MSNIINAFPYIDPSFFLKTKNVSDPILSSNNLTLYASGRAAIYHAIKAASLPAGAVVLVPAFHCGVEVEAIRRAGYPVEFYNIRTDMTIDFESLSGCVSERVKAVLIIHYFGFPQDLDRIMNFCKQNNLALIEDCAHALYSKYRGRWLGTFGEFGVFSFQKTLAMPNGGGLLCNSINSERPDKGKKHFDLAILKTTVKSILQFGESRRGLTGKISSSLIRIYPSGQDIADEVKEAGDTDMRWYYDVPRFDYSNAISFISKALLGKEDYNNTIRMRRKNFTRLIDMFKSGDIVNLLTDRLEEGVCPLALVISTAERDHIVKEMNRRGLYPFIFGRIAHKDLPGHGFDDSRYLSRNLIGLPVHQNLSESDLYKIVDISNEVVEKSGKA